MRRITFWATGMSCLLVILVACLGLLSIWSARTFIIKGVNVGLEGVVTVIHSKEATLERFENIVSETLPAAVETVDSMLAADQELSPSFSVIQEKALLRLGNDLLPQLIRLKSTAETISHIIVSANETLGLINILPGIQLPLLPTEQWQSFNNRLSAIQDNVQGLVEIIVQNNNNGYTAKGPEIRRNLQALTNASQKLQARLVEIKANLNFVLEKINSFLDKITTWINWLAIGLFLVVCWVIGGQIILMRHFWKTRSSRTD